MICDEKLALLTMAFATGVPRTILDNRAMAEYLNFDDPNVRIGSEWFYHNKAIPLVCDNLHALIARELSQRYVALAVDSWTPKHSATHYNGVVLSYVDTTKVPWVYRCINGGIDCILHGKSEHKNTNAQSFTDSIRGIMEQLQIQKEFWFAFVSDGGQPYPTLARTEYLGILWKHCLLHRYALAFSKASKIPLVCDVLDQAISICKAAKRNPRVNIALMYVQSEYAYIDGTLVNLQANNASSSSNHSSLQQTIATERARRSNAGLKGFAFQYGDGDYVGHYCMVPQSKLKLQRNTHNTSRLNDAGKGGNKVRDDPTNGDSDSEEVSDDDSHNNENETSRATSNARHALLVKAVGPKAANILESDRTEPPEATADEENALQDSTDLHVAAWEKFRSTCNPTGIVQLSSTRWEYLSNALDRVMRHKPFISLLPQKLDELNISTPVTAPTAWKALEQFAVLLLDITSMWKYAEGTSYSTAGCSWIINHQIRSCLHISKSDEPAIVEFKKASWKLLAHYTQQDYIDPFSVACCLFDPRNRGEALTTLVPEHYRAGIVPKFVGFLKTMVSSPPSSSSSAAAASPPPSSSTTTAMYAAPSSSAISNDGNEPARKKHRGLSDIISSATSVTSTGGTSNIEAEATKYALGNDTDHCTWQNDSKTCALEWWPKHMYDYPLLAAQAPKFMVVPASSAGIESVWSRAGNIVNEHASHMRTNLAEQLCFVNCNAYDYVDPKNHQAVLELMKRK